MKQCFPSLRIIHSLWYKQTLNNFFFSKFSAANMERVQQKQQLTTKKINKFKTQKRNKFTYVSG